MKKIYTTIFISVMAIFVFAQSGRKASPSGISSFECKSCTPQPNIVHDTICNRHLTDTITVYFCDRTPHDSGWATGMNAYGDQGWAERYVVSGNASVLGGAYFLYSKKHSATATTAAMGKVYSIAAGTGKPNTALGTKNIPFNTMKLTGTGPTIFSFTSPVAVTDSFFMALEFNAYTLATATDTIGVYITKDGERTTTNPNQNCAKFSDGTWNYELTENFLLKTNYQLCAIVDVAGGVENYVSKGDLKLFAAYPNPSANDVTLNYSLAHAGKISIEIFDAQGKSMIKINKGSLSQGTYLEKINVSSFAAGTYFYNVSTENGTLFSKFTVVK